MKKVLNVIKDVFVGFVVVMAICMMIFTIVAVTTFNRGERSIFGYKAFIVLSDSMSATDFEAGDLILVKEVDPTTLEVGDIVAYISQGSGNFGETVTHKIRGLTVTEKGEPGFITYGTTTGVDDKMIVTYQFIQGKYQGRLPKVGIFFQFLRTVPGYISFILLPFLLLIIYQGIGCVRLFRQYRTEQMAELKAEREKLEYERAEAEKMKRELLALKEQMGVNTWDGVIAGEEDT